MSKHRNSFNEVKEMGKMENLEKLEIHLAHIESIIDHIKRKHSNHRWCNCEEPKTRGIGYNRCLKCGKIIKTDYNTLRRDKV